MKKFTLLLFVFGASLIAQAQGTTTPQESRITVNEITLNPSGTEGAFTISLEGNTIYTAYGMDIQLPDGFELNYYKGKRDISLVKNESVYPFEEDRDGNKTFFHNLGINEIAHQCFRVACNSNSNAEFIKTSGPLLKVYVKATAFAKPGKSLVTIKNVELVEKKDAKPFYPADATYPINATNSSSVNINIAASNKFSTCILPFDSEAPANTKVYSCKEVDEANHLINLAEETKMKAYTPYILYAENGCTATVSGTVDENQYVTSATNGLLTGVITLTEVKDGYVLQNQGKGAKFYKANPTAPFSLRAGRCYLKLPATASANAYTMDMTPTGITEISKNATDKVIYDLQGRRVYYPSSNHIYIVNGEKVLMK